MVKSVTPPSSHIGEPLWESISPQQFEEFSDVLVRAMGFQQVEKRSGTGDCGEDIVAYYPAKDPTIRPVSRKWVFQCKHTKRVTKHDVWDEVSNFAGQQIDTWVLVTTAVPSANHRKWLEDLSQSNKAQFYVMGWWRDELNRFVREYCSFIQQNLSPLIVERLRINAYVRHLDPSELDTVIAGCRSFTNDQIQRFARSKYIKGLYVHREIQNYLTKFHATEPQLSRQLKTRCLEVLLGTKANISQIVGTVDLMTSGNAGVLSAPRRAYLTSEAAHSTYGEALSAGMADIIATGWKKELQLLVGQPSRRILESLEMAINGAEGLSETELITKESQHKHLTDAVDTVVNTVEEVREFLDKNKQRQRFRSLVTLVDLIIQRNVGARRIRRTDQFQGASSRIASFFPSETTKMSNALVQLSAELRKSLCPAVVIIDRAGGGKTSLLCELATSLAQEVPTVLLFGKEDFRSPEAIVKKVEQILGGGRQATDASHIEEVDRMLSARGLFVNVFIDGINESRWIPELDTSLGVFLEWSRLHRIRVTISCRDIYWGFFDSEKWRHLVYETKRNELYQFSKSEYGVALPLYLKHYRIDCQLEGNALDACRHPLLLRFFCEAHGSPDSGFVQRGVVADIRLKDLFDVYYIRKTDQIRNSLRHKNADMTSRFLLDLARHLYNGKTKFLLTSEVGEATGHEDISTQDSLYLRFLDEDIIIEEDPADQIESRKIHFVYEEFMEYILAKAFLAQPWRAGDSNVRHLFAELKSSSAEWINARGVVEYIAQMLCCSERPLDTDAGMNLLEAMIESGGIWIDAFWAVVGKLPKAALDTCLFDMFHSALRATPAGSAPRVKAAVEAMARYDSGAVEPLAVKLLWSTILPGVLRWSEIERLPSMGQEELDRLAVRLAGEIEAGTRYGYLKIIGTDQIMNWVLPFVNEKARAYILSRRKKWGTPGKFDFTGLMYDIRLAFAQEQPYLLNGLFHQDDRVRSFCADRIRFVKSGRMAFAYLCRRLADAETTTAVRDILRDSSVQLQSTSL